MVRLRFSLVYRCEREWQGAGRECQHSDDARDDVVRGGDLTHPTVRGTKRSKKLTIPSTPMVRG